MSWNSLIFNATLVKLDILKKQGIRNINLDANKVQLILFI